MNNTEQALEHGEHAAHAAHARDPFDRWVTMTVAFTAGLLACVTLLSHRAHTETLALQLEANEQSAKASNKWNHFQAKKNRQNLYETAATRSRMDLEHPSVPPEKSSEGWRLSVQNDIKAWNLKTTRYEKETTKMEEEAHEYEVEATNLRKESLHVHHLGNYYDLGELAVELGLVLSSMAVLTKKRSFWYGSMGFTGVGTLLMCVGVVQQYILH